MLSRCSETHNLVSTAEVKTGFEKTETRNLLHLPPFYWSVQFEGGKAVVFNWVVLDNGREWHFLFNPMLSSTTPGGITAQTGTSHLMRDDAFGDDPAANDVSGVAALQTALSCIAGNESQAPTTVAVGWALLLSREQLFQQLTLAATVQEGAQPHIIHPDSHQTIKLKHYLDSHFPLTLFVCLFVL